MVHHDTICIHLYLLEIEFNITKNKVFHVLLHLTGASTGWLRRPGGVGLTTSHVLPAPQRPIQLVEVPGHYLRKR